MVRHGKCRYDPIMTSKSANSEHSGATFVSWRFRGNVGNIFVCINKQIDWLIKLWFNVPLYKQQAISETLFPADVLASTEKTKREPGDAVANIKNASELQKKINSKESKTRSGRLLWPLAWKWRGAILESKR